MARSAEMAAVLCLQQRGVSHQAPQPLNRANAPARAAAKLTARTATEVAAASSSSSATTSTTAAGASPPPASASCLRPVPSSCTRELSQRFAPPRPHWLAEPAASQWIRSEAVSQAALGFPLSPQQPAAGKVRARGPPLGRPSGAGRTPQAALAPGAGVVQVGRSVTPPAYGGGAKTTEVVEEEDPEFFK
ncbi:translation initiation factor IF-2-like isoform X2 [Elephas maximus indicus]|uniref:translation initiation factor IF-2-like isoform X2 n=1 Tax=Elephas maximus indicus TaxID=99487 RepID=UPI0021163C99|nr:translation initiation factor IF-2-like isoform X2 [Elephas maximus indicus]XP_049735816.1 translation initiation factor IF-2-like isoform X2 [Elephas maximus indicus]XP_049735817.1 translation initiation factor IF-2-like isoform X2 [Elephas maximus indicus]